MIDLVYIFSDLKNLTKKVPIGGILMLFYETSWTNGTMYKDQLDDFLF